MKNFSAFLLCLLLSLAACTPTPKQPQQLAAETQAEQPADVDPLLMCETPDDLPSQILYRKAYVCSYNKETRLPNWVAWKLTKGHTYGKLKRSEIEFHEDTDVPAPQVNTFDYSRSGYDRGHMCPAGDNKWNKEALTQCFLMTNICPQNHELNKEDWNDLEIQCRHWARKYGSIYVVCGPVLQGSRHKTIGKSKVTVPDAFFKVVLCLEGKPRAIGFVYPNEPGSGHRKDYVKTIDEIEDLTGIKFFKGVDKEELSPLL